MKSKNLLFPYIFGCSVVGPYHIKNNIVCQDACYYKTFQKYGIIAVADGLGSVPKADIGAKLAVRSAVKRAKDIILKKEKENAGLLNLECVVLDSFKFARGVLENKANKEKFELGELACTLILVIMYEDNVSIAHIGDGGVVGIINNNIKILSKPDELEYINDVTPITSIEWNKSLRISSFSNVRCLAVFTDGCQRACLIKEKDKFKPFNGFFEPLFSYAYEIKSINKAKKDVKKLLSSKKMTEYFEDDKTLVIGVLKEK